MKNYKVFYEEYDRGGGEFKIANFSAEDNIQALAVVMQKCMYGCELSEESTEEELVNAMYSCNGDGCGFVCKVVDLDEDKVLFEECTHEEENWGECYVEYYAE